MSHKLALVRSLMIEHLELVDSEHSTTPVYLWGIVSCRERERQVNLRWS